MFHPSWWATLSLRLLLAAWSWSASVVWLGERARSSYFPASLPKFKEHLLFMIHSWITCDLNLIIGLMTGGGGEGDSWREHMSFRWGGVSASSASNRACYPLTGRSAPLLQAQKFWGKYRGSAFSGESTQTYPSHRSRSCSFLTRILSLTWQIHGSGVFNLLRSWAALIIKARDWSAFSALSLRMTRASSYATKEAICPLHLTFNWWLITLKFSLSFSTV